MSVLGRLRLDLFLDLWKKVIKIVACEHLFSVLLTVLCWHKMVDDAFAMPRGREAIFDHLLHCHRSDLGRQSFQTLLHFDHVVVLLLVLCP